MGKKYFSVDATFVYCVVAVIFASLTEQKMTEEAEGENNGYQINLTESIDKLLPFVSRFIVENKMDPLTITDIRRSFWIVGPFLFSSFVYTELTYSLSSGLLYYLSELERRDATILAYRDKTFTIDGNVAFHDLLFSYDYFLKLLFLQHHGKIFAEAYSIWASISVHFNVLSCELTLERLELNNIESIRIFSEGNTLTDRFIASIANVAVLLMKNTLIEKMEEQAGNFVREHVERIGRTSCPWKDLF